MLIQEWERVRTDWLTVLPAVEPNSVEGITMVPKLVSADS
jgi:hypothetical protein